MIKLLYAGTPAGNKALLMLEELGVPYSMQAVNVFKGIQRTPEYKSIIPTGKIPAIIDENGKVTFETGAILFSLAQKYNKFIPKENSSSALSWFFWANSDLSPKFFQHYRAKVQNPENIEMHKKIEGNSKEWIGESNLRNLLETLDTQLIGKSYIVGEFSIADISAYTWIKNYVEKNAIPNLIDGLNNVQTWLATMDNRDAVKKMAKISSEFSWEVEPTIEEIENFIKN